MAKFDTKGLKLLQDKMEKAGASIDQFYVDCNRELAARLLRKVIKRTPVGVAPEVGDEPKQVSKEVKAKYWKGYVGGTLRRGWTAKTEQEAQNSKKVSVAKAVMELPVTHTGNQYNIDVVNCVSYASYVEYGHKQIPGRFVPALGKRLKEGWVDGKLMLTNSVNELSTQTNAILKKKLKVYLGKFGFNDK